ncbi:ATP-binding protein [Aquabacterium sp. A7-Y]|uniref:sensor histidine kinase n=1 Tax=Aquabacterium sp. A7-Y TaxID=1349605 RepID=UPI00223D6380|nr:ATP-binding protein [Aquabacterium sp. A7-Y]MCW7538783.1 ATP-binding protein [Aquabacterium sp. A7-Y]
MRAGPPSIERQLRWRLLFGSLAVSALLSAAVALLVAREVSGLLDYQLEQVARVLVERDIGSLAPGHVPAAEDQALHLDVQVWDTDGRRLYRSSSAFELPMSTPLGFSQVRSGGEDDAVELQLFTLRTAHRVAQVAHPLDLRRELARDAGLKMLGPALAAVAALSLFVVLTVRRALAPLRRLSKELARRDAQALGAIVLPDAPGELQLPLHTLNELLGRLAVSFAGYRQFAADAAHELRTPLAAVRLQADNLAQAADAAEREQASAELRGGIDRVQHLVEQLLDLARLEARPLAARAPVDLAALAGECLVARAAEASGRGIELSLDADGEAPLPADPLALRMLLDNLVDNALKYTPPGSLVELAVQRRHEVLALLVRDRGPGIPQHARQRVLERFYRHEAGDRPGSGLGLAIVAEVARSHRAGLALRDRGNGPGLEVEVLFPLSASGAEVDSATRHDVLRLRF